MPTRSDEFISATFNTVSTYPINCCTTFTPVTKVEEKVDKMERHIDQLEEDIEYFNTTLQDLKIKLMELECDLAKATCTLKNVDSRLCATEYSFKDLDDRVADLEVRN